MGKIFWSCLVFLFLSTFCLAKGEDAKLKLAKWSSAGTFSAIEDLPRSCIFGSWRSESFLNQNYHGALLRDQLVPRMGLDIGYSIRVYGPLEIALCGFYSWYETNYDDYLDEGMIAHKGMDVSLRYYVLPYIGTVSDYVFPYIGAGYQTSRLANLDDQVGKKPEVVHAVGTGGFFIEAGMRVFFYNTGDMGFFLFGAYKQTLPVSSDKLFRSFHLGVGYSF